MSAQYLSMLVHRASGDPKIIINAYNEKHIEYTLDGVKHRATFIQNRDDIKDKSIKSDIYFSIESTSHSRRLKRISNSAKDEEIKRGAKTVEPDQSTITELFGGPASGERPRKRTIEENTLVMAEIQGRSRKRVELKLESKRMKVSVPKGASEVFKNPIDYMLNLRKPDRFNLTKIMMETIEVPAIMYEITKEEKLIRRVAVECDFYYCFTSSPNDSKYIDTEVLEKGKGITLKGCTFNANLLLNIFLRNELRKLNLSPLKSEGVDEVDSSAYVIYMDEDKPESCKVTGFFWKRHHNTFTLHSEEREMTNFPKDPRKSNFTITLPLNNKNDSMNAILYRLIAKIFSK